MATGKVIQLHLLDGTPDGRIAGELRNWTGKAYKIPRPLLKDSSDKADLRKAGVYFLFGKSEADFEVDVVYIGKAEDVYGRLVQHQSKEFWTEAVVFVSSDANLNKAHVKFLEHNLYNSALRAKRCEVHNLNTPPYSALSDAEKDVMSEFANNLQVLIGAMGYKLFVPLVRSPELIVPATLLSNNLESYYKIESKGVVANAIISNEGFVVLRGSEVSAEITPSMKPHAQKLREKLFAERVIVESDSKLVFTENHLFNSSSQAASVILGGSVNGRDKWKNADNQTIEDVDYIDLPANTTAELHEDENL